MERLLVDADAMSESFSVLTDANGDLVYSFDDIVEAIHIVQTEMGISGISIEEYNELVASGAMSQEDAFKLLGTTAKEASSTIQGSLAMAKASWSNLLTAMISTNMSLEDETKNFVKSVTTVANQVLPKVKIALESAGELVEEIIPEIMEMIPELIDETLPKLITSAVNIIKTLVTGLKDNAPQLGQSAVSIITTLATELISLLPDIIEVGLELIISLANGIIENIDELIDAALELIPAIKETLTSPDSLDQILTTALELIDELAMGLIDAIPQLLSAALDVISGLVEYFVNPENTEKIRSMAGDIVKRIGEGLVSAASNMWSSIKTFVSDVVEEFSTYASDWKSIGSNIVDGIKCGLSTAWETFTGWFSGLLGGLKDEAEGTLEIGSPSKVFARIGGFMAEGLKVGWEDGIGDVTDTVNKSLDFSKYSIPTLTASVATETSMTNTGASMFGGVTVIQNIYAEKMNAVELMREAKYRAKQAVILGV